MTPEAGRFDICPKHPGGVIKVTVQMEVDEGKSEPVAIARIERHDPLQAGTLGLTLPESKALLEALQRQLVESQFRLHIENQRICNQCGARRAIKDYHPACFKSLFGDVTLRVPRLLGCGCVGQPQRLETVKIDGLSNWGSPELEYIQTRLAATLPYARTTELLGLLLPIASGNSTATVRRRTLAVGRRLNVDLEKMTKDHRVACESGREPITAVGLDGGYVRSCRPGSDQNFEVVVGRILNSDDSSSSVGFVRTLENNHEAGLRLQRRIQEHGSIPEPLAVFTDGDPGLYGLVPNARHILDWFHLTRHLTILKNVLYDQEAIDQFPTHIHDGLCKALTSMKWRLWHGRVWGATCRLQTILFLLKRTAINRKRAARRLRRLATKLPRYLKNNANSLPNYGKRYRQGKRISTDFVESAVNQLIDKRMAKSQQMRWSVTGAHSLLQVRAEVVDGKLDAAFARWYPGFKHENFTGQLAA